MAQGMAAVIPDWFISDTHWGHANINEYCQRLTPEFSDQGKLEWLMIRNWRSLVKPTDTILHLGDIAFRGFGMDLLKDLPGRKLFVRGNHDGHLSPEDLAAVGFTEIDPPIYETPNGGEILCTHYPQKLEPRGRLFNVHGHVHNNPHDSTFMHLNISVECWHYAPVKGSIVLAAAERAIELNQDPKPQRAPLAIHYKGK